MASENACVVLCKVRKNIIFQNKTLLLILVMFYRHNKTFWYQFCNFKHFLKAENSEDILASLCVEFSIGLSNPVWDWVTITCTQGTHRVQFANIRKMFLYQGLPHCLRLCVNPCMASHAQSLNSSLHAWPQNLEAFQTMQKQAKKDKMWSILQSNIRFLWFLQSMFPLSFL